MGVEFCRYEGHHFDDIYDNISAQILIILLFFHGSRTPFVIHRQLKQSRESEVFVSVLCYGVVATNYQFQ